MMIATDGGVGAAEEGMQRLAPAVVARPPWPSRAVRYYALGVLTLAYAVSFIDRTILSMLIDPIKADLRLSDTQISLLSGLAFSLFYAVMGLPLGRLVDRASRKLVIAGGVALWSVVTATCGLAGNFGQLFLSRMGVGVGEAALSPGAFSMLSDLFPPRERNRAGGVYALGVSLGAALAYLVGGAVIEFARNSGGLSLPLVGEVTPWRFAFIIVGLPGLLVALLMLTVREPQRRGAVSQNQAALESDAKLGAFLQANWKAAFGCLFGYALINVPFITILQWGPSFLSRSHGLTPGEVGLVLGLIFLGPSLAGQLVGGVLSDWRFAKGSRAAPLQNAIVCGLLLVFTSGLATVAPSLPWAIALIGATTFLVCASVGHGPAALTLMSPNHLRGQMTAVYFLVIQVVVLATSTTLVAVISDYILRDPARINVGMAVVSGGSSLLGALVLKLALKPFSQAVLAQSLADETSADT